MKIQNAFPDLLSRRGFLLSSFASGLLSAMPDEADAALQGNFSLASLSPRPKQIWNPNTNKLVFFGVRGVAACGSDIDEINGAIFSRDWGPDKLTPIFIYPNDPMLNDNYVALATSIEKIRRTKRFLEFSGPQDKVLQVAKNYRAKYYDFDKKPIDPADDKTKPFSHTRYVYLMDKNMKNIDVVAPPDDNAPQGTFKHKIEAALRNAIGQRPMNTPQLNR